MFGRLRRRKWNHRGTQAGLINVALEAISDFNPLVPFLQLYSELTLRSRSSAFVDSEGQKFQTVSVKCLACDISVYRIKTEVSPDMDAKEGPMLPEEDWAEHDVLRSRTGWIEVYCGHGGSKARLLFSLLLGRVLCAPFQRSKFCAFQ